MYSISIHALLAESDQSPESVSVKAGLFLSTLSLRRATRGADDRQERACISIHALLAESDELLYHFCPVNHISIHALLAESDVFLRSLKKAAKNISIHALLAESD